jgi:hypothetical protein
MIYLRALGIDILSRNFAATEQVITPFGTVDVHNNSLDLMSLGLMDKNGKNKEALIFVAAQSF